MVFRQDGSRATPSWEMAEKGRTQLKCGGTQASCSGWVLLVLLEVLLAQAAVALHDLSTHASNSYWPRLGVLELEMPARRGILGTLLTS